MKSAADKRQDHLPDSQKTYKKAKKLVQYKEEEGNGGAKLQDQGSSASKAKQRNIFGASKNLFGGH